MLAMGTPSAARFGPMAKRLKKHAAREELTPYEELRTLAAYERGEIIQGELMVSSFEAEHDYLVHVLSGHLWSPFVEGRDPAKWQILQDIEVHLDKDIVQPNLAGWRKARLPKPPSERERFVAVAPDWVCEILTSWTARTVRSLKFPLYARAEIAHVWLIDPRARTLEVLRRQNEHWLMLATFAGQDRVRAEPFDAMELDLDVLWAAHEGREE